MAPQLAPVADQMLQSAGFVDQSPPPIIDGTGMPPPPQQMVDTIPENTNPLSPSNPGAGLTDGIEGGEIE
jgi:hypothetical protein